MGGYLGRTRSSPPPLAVSTGDPQKGPLPPVHRVSRSLRVNSTDGYLNMADRLSFEEDAALTHPQQHPGRVVVVHTQRYPEKQARNLLNGVFSSMFLCGRHKSEPTLTSSRVSRSSVILKVVSTKGRATLRFVLGQPVMIIWSFLTGHLSTQSRQETWISALQDSSHVQAKEKKELTTLREGGEGFAKQKKIKKKKKGSLVTKRPCDEGKDSDGHVSVPSAFRRLIVNGVLASFIPMPGPLGRDACFKKAAKNGIKESQVAFKSSCKRNAIASSYSSSLAQWPPERIRARATQGAAPCRAIGAAPGATLEAAAGPAAHAILRVTRRATGGASTGAASGGAAYAARGATGDAPSGAAPDAASGASPGAAAPTSNTSVSDSGTAAGAAADAAPGDAAGTTRDSVPGAARSPVSGAAQSAAPGAAPGATPGAAPGAAPAAAPCTLQLPSPASSQLQAPAKKAGEKGRATSSLGSLKKKEKKPRKGKYATITDVPQVQQGDPRNGLPISDTPKPVKRKIPLLLPHRRDVPLILPPPPELCFRITAEDFDLEKKAAMQWINKVLKDDGAKARCN